MGSIAVDFAFGEVRACLAFLLPEVAAGGGLLRLKLFEESKGQGGERA
jgi:hypothetical protein